MVFVGMRFRLLWCGCPYCCPSPDLAHHVAQDDREEKPCETVPQEDQPEPRDADAVQLRDGLQDDLDQEEEQQACEEGDPQGLREQIPVRQEQMVLHQAPLLSAADAGAAALFHYLE